MFSLRGLLGNVSVSKLKRGLQAVLMFAVVGLPVILVVAGLLSASSNTFSDWFGRFFDFNLDGGIVFLRVVATPIITWLLLAQGLYIFHLHKHRDELETNSLTLSDSTRQSLGAALSLTIIVLNLFYLVFVIAQLRYDFGNLAQLIADQQLTSFSELAVARFWELIMVALINIGLLFLGGDSLRSLFKTQWLKLASQLNVGLLLVSTLLLIFSAWQRLSLYIGGYGFSHKRFSAYTFLPVLIVGALLIGAGVFYAHRQVLLQKVALSIAVLFFGLMLLLPNTLIVNQLNYSLYKSGNVTVFDPLYTVKVDELDYKVARLKDDGSIPAYYTNDVRDNDGLWVAAQLLRDADNTMTSQAQRDYLQSQIDIFVGESGDRNWREFNLAEALLRRQLVD
jgi:hypothetical protein